jgi:hypothetical protein
LTYESVMQALNDLLSGNEILTTSGMTGDTLRGIVCTLAQLDRLFESHGDGSRPFVQELVCPVDRGIEHPKPARSRGEHWFEANRPLRVAELASGRVDRVCAVDASERGCRNAEAV